MSAKPKRKLVLDESSSSSEEEEEEEKLPPQPRRSQRAISKPTTIKRTGEDALDDVLREEEESIWKEEEEHERDQRLHFVVDDDGAGYLDDDVDHQGKEYATMHSDEEIDEQAEAVSAAAAASRNKKKKAKVAAHQQQDLFSMFTRVERKTRQEEEEDVVDEFHADMNHEAAAAAVEEEEDDTQALLAALRKSSSSKSAAKPTGAKRPNLSSASKLKPVTTYKRSAVVAATVPKVEHAYEDDAMIFGDETVEEKAPESAPAKVEEEEKEVAPAPAAPVPVKPQSTRAKLLAAAASKPLPVLAQPAELLPSPPSAPASDLLEVALPTGAFLPTSTSASLMPTTSATPLMGGAPTAIFPLAPTSNSTAEEGESARAIEFYWTDIYENRPGELYLFGRVETNGSESTSSCSVCLKHVSRSLIVLPTSPCTSEEERRAVLDEVLDVIRKTRLEKSALGAVRFKSKWVNKSYAFELPDIPRGRGEYLLIEYSMSLERSAGMEDFPQSGRHYAHVFGTNQSTIERFLLANKIMGPCWLRFETKRGGGDQGAEVIKLEKRGASHCKYECEVDGSSVTLSITANKPAPCVSVLSLALKTVVDPSTHQHQIVVATGVLHSRIPLDSGEVLREDAGQVKFQLVRPLGASGELDKYRHLKFQHPNVMFQPNERALLSCLLAMMHSLDADFLCGHNISGFELDLILSRLKANNIKQWSKLGRLNLSRFPTATKTNGRQSHFGVLTPGRLIADTYTSAQEFLLGQREYSLTSLCESVGLLKSPRPDLDPSQVPRMFETAQGLVALLHHAVETCQLQLRLAFKLEIFTLSLELTAIAGNLWRRTLGSGRAERIEYLLSHAFHNQDFIIPDKERATKKQKGGPRRAPASYAGGLVLEPKPGLYDSYVILLDFNALYPSIIQEYNICFTTVKRPAVTTDGTDAKRSKRGGNSQMADEDDAAAAAAEEEEEQQLPIMEEGEEEDAAAAFDASEEAPLPVDNGRGPDGLAILPRVIQNIVDRRKQVQAALASETDVLKKRQLDTRQKALKITANSMYGCLGFSSSRYFARPLASLITSQGRMILMDTVETTERLGFKVLYGDTDSIMIDTQLGNTSEMDGGGVAPVMQIADKIIRAVNPKYKYLKIALDGIFKTLLLLKKKKYASLKLVLSKLPSTIELRRETKGLDLVRRDWCPASQRLGSEVLNLILAPQQKEEICDGIRAVLAACKEALPNLPLSEFTITKGLNKHPKDYPDSGKGNPHVQVAKRMLERSKIVNVGDHIPYVICSSTSGAAGGKAETSVAQRAYHPDEIAESNGELQVDLDWYVSTQLFPPVQRLVEVMDGITAGEVATALGMDAAKFQQSLANGHSSNSSALLADSHAAHFDSIFGQTFQADLDRFALCDKIVLTCPECSHEFNFDGVCRLPEGDALALEAGTSCPHCHAKQVVDTIVLQNLLTLNARRAIAAYYRNELVPKEAMVESEFKTRQLGLRDYIPYEKRRISLKREVSAKQLWIQLYYLVCLVDVERFKTLLARENELRKKKGQAALRMELGAQDQEDLTKVKHHLEHTFLHNSAFGWIEPEFFQRVFGLSAPAPPAAE